MGFSGTHMATCFWDRELFLCNGTLVLAGVGIGWWWHAGGSQKGEKMTLSHSLHDLNSPLSNESMREATHFVRCYLKTVPLQMSLLHTGEKVALEQDFISLIIYCGAGDRNGVG